MQVRQVKENTEIFQILCKMRERPENLDDTAKKWECGQLSIS
jgi:hypothetical protein